MVPGSSPITTKVPMMSMVSKTLLHFEMPVIKGVDLLIGGVKHCGLPQKDALCKLVLMFDINVMQITVLTLKNAIVVDKMLFDESKRVDYVGEDEIDGTLILFEPCM